MKESPEVVRIQRHFAGGHIAFLLLVFLPPLVLAYGLSAGPDVVFFAGRGIAFTLTAAVLALFLPVLYTCVRPTSRFLLVSVWLPAVTLAFVGLMYRRRTTSAAEALSGRPCFDDPAKQGLQLAYEAADEFYGACQAWRPQVGNRPAGAPEDVHGVAECPNYEIAARKWGRQWDYLASLERRFPCGGICYPSRRLFVDAGTYGPSCGPFAAEWLWVARVQASVLLWYSVFVMVMLVPSHMLLLAPMVRRYDDALVAHPDHF